MWSGRWPDTELNSDQPQSMRHPYGSGRAREAGNTGNGTGFAGVRGHARSHMDGLKYRVVSFGWFYFPAKG